MLERRHRSWNACSNVSLSVSNPESLAMISRVRVSPKGRNIAVLVVRHVRRDKSTAEGRRASQAVGIIVPSVQPPRHEVGAVVGDVEIENGERWKRIEPPANWTTFKNSRSLRTDAVRRGATSPRATARTTNRRLRALSRAYEEGARCETSRDLARAKPQRDGDSRLTWPFKYKRRRARTDRDRERRTPLSFTQWTPCS